MDVNIHTHANQKDAKVASEAAAASPTRSASSHASQGFETTHSSSASACSSATVSSSIPLSSSASDVAMPEDLVFMPSTPTRERSVGVEVEHPEDMGTPALASTFSSCSSLSPTQPFFDHVNAPMSPIHNPSSPTCCMFIKSATISTRSKHRSTEKLTENDAQVFTVYRIKILPRDGDAWYVERRYTDFVELKRRVRQSCPLTAKFPGRLLKETDKGMQERERLLNRFLAIAIAAVPQYPMIRYCLGSFLKCTWAAKWQPHSLMPKIVSTTMALISKECQDRGSICIKQHFAAQELRRVHSSLRWKHHDTELQKSVFSLPWVTTSIVGRKEGSGNPTQFEILVTAENGNEWLAQRRYSDFVVLREYVKGFNKELGDEPFPAKTLFRCVNSDLTARQTGLDTFLARSVDKARSSEHMRRLLSVFLCLPIQS